MWSVILQTNYGMEKYLVVGNFKDENIGTCLSLKICELTVKALLHYITHVL